MSFVAHAGITGAQPATRSMSYDVDGVVPRRYPQQPLSPYAPGANDAVSSCPDDRVTKHEMNRSPWSHVAWSGA